MVFSILLLHSREIILAVVVILSLIPQFDSRSKMSFLMTPVQLVVCLETLEKSSDAEGTRQPSEGRPYIPPELISVCRQQRTSSSLRVLQNPLGEK